jgi:asparagine synthase (glutamine-hydrolysing)
MSAIAGIYQLNGEPISPDHSAGLMKVLEQFPANDIQTWQNENIFLGCHAQWITPESVGEKLPYYDHYRRLAITADAIIDNREELFEKLQIEKSKHKTMSDSELILLSYHEWGEECPKFLVGDFAFMIWDERKQRLFGARDFSGTRTLYYFFDQRRIVFCTIMQPLFTLPYIVKNLNEEWLAEYLAIPGMLDSTEASSTVYKNIKQIPPCHTLSMIKGNISLKRYMNVNARKKIKLNSNEEYLEGFCDVFQTAVKSRLRTHHNVGAHLSGGLDSGAVVSFAAKELKKEKKQLHTFSYIPVSDFEDWTPKSRLADERPYIQSTVNHVGNINDQYLDFEGKSPLSEVNIWLDTLEMPYKFFENSYWLKGIYEKAQQLGIGILLNGARGNYTISWGSALDFYTILFKRLKWIQLNHELSLYSRNKGIGKTTLLKKIGKKAFPFLEQNHLTKMEFPIAFLINPEFANRTKVFEKLRANGNDIKAPVLSIYEARKKQFDNVSSWNINGTSGSKLSLRYGIWDRDPTNDLRVIQYCLAIPDEQFVKNGYDRALIRRATEGLLPNKVRLNQKFRGIQGADGIHRMIPHWETFIQEVELLCKSPIISEIMNLEVIQSSISNLRQPKSKETFSFDFKILMRSLIVFRFLQKVT